MSRHRIVRRMNYEDEYYDDDEYDYGHSYEDRYCISPSTAAQFTYNRDQDFNLSSYMEEEIPEETEMDLDPVHAQAAAPVADRGLKNIDKGRLQSCLEEIHNVMGDSIPDGVLTEAIIRHDFNIRSTLDEFLSKSDVPKPQRAPRKKRDRAQGDDSDIEDLLSEINALDQQENVPFKGAGGRFSFQAGVSPPAALTMSNRGGVDKGKMSGEAGVLTPVCNPSNVRGDSSPLSGSGTFKGGGKDESNTSPSLKTGSAQGSSLIALIQHRRESEQPKLRSGDDPRPQNSNIGFSLSELAGLQKKKDMAQPVPTFPVPLSQTEMKQSGGLSLSELILTQKGPSRPTEAAAACQETDKPRSGLSLSELMSAQNRQSASSSPSSSDISSSPQTPGTKGLSLTELVNLHAGHKKTTVASSPNSEKKGGESPQGVSLSQLAKMHSDPQSKPANQQLGAGTASPQSGGVTLADLAKLQAKEKAPAMDRDKKDTSQSATSGLSLSDLIKQREQGGLQPAAPSVKEVSADMKQNQTGSSPTHSQNAGKGPQTEKKKSVEEKTDVALSLVDCLKKSLTIRREDPGSIPSPEVEEMEEEECMMWPDKTMDIEVDFFSPIVIDPALKKVPSLFARCICLQLAGPQDSKPNPVKPTHKFEKKKVRFPTFQYQHQTRKLKVPSETPLHKVTRFDFGTPSPDDLVKARQRAAFTRSGQHLSEESSATS